MVAGGELKVVVFSNDKKESNFEVVTLSNEKKESDLEMQDASEPEESEDVIETLLGLVLKKSAGLECVQGFFGIGTHDPTSAYYVTGALCTVCWFIAPVVLEAYLENETNKSLLYDYLTVCAISTTGGGLLVLGFTAASCLLVCTYGIFERDRHDLSPESQLFVLFTAAGITWSIAAGLLSHFGSKFLAFMSLYIVFFVLRVVSSGLLSMCKCNGGSFPYVLCAIKWLVDGAVGVLGGFIFYLIMSSSGFIIEKTEIPTLRNACLILGGLHNPILMPLLPAFAPNLYTFYNNTL